ncbi:MAG: hypothetical protein NTW08_06430 [Gammaproteobacteria bacterium]|nr:hypothetical protein [Gammaproteobacteria bacterium]
MSDWKSKIPDLQEVWSMTVKLAQDVKVSVTEIVKDYKEKHPSTPESAKTEEKPAKPAPVVEPPAEPKPKVTAAPAEKEKDKDK